LRIKEQETHLTLQEHDDDDELQDLMSSDDHFLEKVQFSDEATFHVSGAVNRRNVRIW